MQFSYTFKTEELPPAGDAVRASFVKDQADFVAFSEIYGDGYLERYDSKLLAVKEVVEPKQLTLSMQAITAKLYAALDNDLQPQLDSTKRYGEMAGDKLTNPISKWDITNTKKLARTRDVEKLNINLKNIIGLIDKNSAVLQEKGLTTAMRDNLESLRNQIVLLSNQQSEAMNQRKRLVEDNKGLLNEFWEIVNDLLKTGKTIYKRTSKAKTDEYTQKLLLSRIRTARKAAVQSGNASATEGTTGQ